MSVSTDNNIENTATTPATPIEILRKAMHMAVHRVALINLYHYDDSEQMDLDAVWSNIEDVLADENDPIFTMVSFKIDVPVAEALQELDRVVNDLNSSANGPGGPLAIATAADSLLHVAFFGEDSLAELNNFCEGTCLKPNIGSALSLYKASESLLEVSDKHFYIINVNAASHKGDSLKPIVEAMMDRTLERLAKQRARSAAAIKADFAERPVVTVYRLLDPIAPAALADALRKSLPDLKPTRVSALLTTSGINDTVFLTVFSHNTARNSQGFRKAFRRAGYRTVLVDQCTFDSVYLLDSLNNHVVLLQIN